MTWKIEKPVCPTGENKEKHTQKKIIMQWCHKAAWIEPTEDLSTLSLYLCQVMNGDWFMKSTNLIPIVIVIKQQFDNKLTKEFFLTTSNIYNSWFCIFVKFKYLSLEQQLLSLKTMTEAWYNDVFEKYKSSNMSILIHFYLYNWSYCYGIKSDDHMNLN